MSKIYWIVIALMIVAGSVAAQPVPRFETAAACPLPVPAGEKAECGYLVVRENRRQKSGRTIRLPVIILRSDNPNPKADPVLRTLGGPGASSLRMVTGRRFSPWLKERDQIIFEQRGTKYAQPALECPEVSEAKIGAVRDDLNAKAARERELSAVRRCRERLVTSGIDLAAYNSAESAADIEDLRRALKLEKINLLGVSYSARLMLNVMRDYPAGVRSVVLESTLPLEVDYDEVGVDAIVRSLDLFFGKCAADAACNAAFPQLETRFYELVEKWNAAPLAIAVKNEKNGESVNVRLSGRDLVTWLVDYSLSADGNTITAAPLKIRALVDGDYSPLKDYAESKLQPETYSLGMRYSVWCREEMPFESYARIAAQSTRYPKLNGYEVQSLPDVCRVWKLPAAPKIENRPVKSAIPTLVIAGEFDAYTPPEWGKTATANLPNSFFVTVPWVGHGPSFNSPLCVSEMIAEFFNDPAAAPKQGCIERIGNFFKFKTGKS